MTKRNGLTRFAQGKQGAAMKFMRASAFASSLMIFPQFGLAEGDGVWRANEPVWKASTPAKWSNVIDPLEWARSTQSGWERTDAFELRIDCPPQAPTIHWQAETPIPLRSPATWIESPVIQPAAKEQAPQASRRPLGNETTSPIRLVGGREDRQRADRIGTYLPDAATVSDAPELLPESASHPESPQNNFSGWNAAQPLNVHSAASPIDAPAQVQASEPAPREIIPTPREQILPPDLNPSPAAKILRPVGDCCAPATLGRPTTCRRLLAELFCSSDNSIPNDPANEGAGFLSAFGPTGPRFSLRGEYLMWWANNDRVPVLATTGPASSGGIIGQPGTTSLYGPGPVDLTNRIGGRFRASLLFDEDNNHGVDGSYMFLGQRQSNFLVSSNTTPVISRPVFVLNNNQENAETVAFPNYSTGSLQISSTSEFWGADANLFKRLLTSPERTIDLFVGYRYMNLSESISIVESITAGPNAPDPAGTRVLVQDRFGTQNVFNGGQIGGSFEQRWSRLFVNLRASMAFGVNQQTIEIGGNQVRTRPGQAPEYFTGGLLAAQSNIGRFGNNRFSVAPDVALNLGYQFSPAFRGYVGYSFLHWTNVVRPGQQIDRTVDLTYIPNTPPGIPPSGQRRPGVLDQQSDFWAQGLNFGIEYLW